MFVNRDKSVERRAIVKYHEETFEEKAVKEQAARVLESNELLIWLAMSRNESVPQTRHYYERLLAGFSQDARNVEWEDVYGPDSEDEARLAVQSSRSSLGSSKSSKQNSTAAGSSKTASGGGSGGRSGSDSKKRGKSGERSQRKRRSGAAS
ncbi:hypothetical protein NA57DRAFT_75531 [Rhizodiscina lignyota]|uniref:Uncharacterized protein n=1 Tax=Rhizodiscina lignyota TaxID=1504668 RepID=A0A9P4IIQ2_9PEZI|nr:hypothetical protein NA57DRAFT_75531 [Rhizodiscina lignyota]